MFGGRGCSNSSYLVEVVKKEDVVSDRDLCGEHWLLFFDIGGHKVGRGGDLKAEE